MSKGLSFRNQAESYLHVERPRSEEECVSSCLCTDIGELFEIEHFPLKHPISNNRDNGRYSYSPMGIPHKPKIVLQVAYVSTPRNKSKD